MSEIKDAVHFTKLKDFFARPVCQRATKPLRDGVEIAVHIAGADAISLHKINGEILLAPHAPTSPDMSFWIGPEGIDELVKLETEDIGEVGIALIKLMLSKEEAKLLKAKVHIGTFQLLRNGYLGVLPLGGATVMKFLASKGFGNIGKIKDAISSLRG